MSVVISLMGIFNFSIDVNKIGSIASIAVGLPTILFWIFIAIKNWIYFKRSKNVKDGIYQGYWIDPQNQQINCEILHLKRTFSGLRAKPIYIHKSYHDYVLKARPYLVNKFIFNGFWKTSSRSVYMGPALFHLDDEKNTFSGKWLGPRSSGKINGGDWYLSFYKNDGNCYLESAFKKRFELMKEIVFPNNSIITDIIKKHENLKQGNCIIDNVKLSLGKDSFNPTLGKISIPMIRYVSSIVKDTDKILDLGTGSGFYPIYLAKNNRCKSVGVDININLIHLAKNNASFNKVTDLVEFRQSTKYDLFKSIDKNEHFDYIIANLPFSKISSTIKSKNSIFYSSFSGNPYLLENLILGSQFHIKPQGKLIFCYGESGYMNLLEALVDVSSWEYLKEIDKIESKDDKFFIFELELSRFVKERYQSL